MRLFFFDEVHDPADRFVEDRRFKRIDNELAVPPGRDQARLLEQIQMVGNAGLGQGEGVGDLAGIPVALLQHLEDAATRRVLECFEQTVH